MYVPGTGTGAGSTPALECSFSFILERHGSFPIVQRRSNTPVRVGHPCGLVHYLCKLTRYFQPQGGALPVDCGASGTNEGVMPIPSIFLFNLPVPETQIKYKCCKGDLCNVDAAPDALVTLSKGVRAKLDLGTLGGNLDLVANVRALQGALACPHPPAAAARSFAEHAPSPHPELLPSNRSIR